MRAYQTSQGNWQVNFSEGGKQRTLYLGRDFDNVSADRVSRIVADILSCRKRGDDFPQEVYGRIEKLPERVRRSMERLDLISGVSTLTLGKLLSSFHSSRCHLKKPQGNV